MKRSVYFRLQAKRFARAIPSAAAIALVLLFCIVIAFTAFLDNEEKSDAKIEIGIVGNADDTYLSLGMAALQNFDSSRLALALNFMSEDEARAALEGGKISAYIIIPDDFVMNAYHGDVGKLTYVTSPRAVTMANIVKDEILDMVSVLLVESQRGIYASGELADDLTDMRYGAVADDAAIEYVDLILSRSKMYKTDILGVSEGLGLVPSVFCGVIVLFLMLFGIGFSGVCAEKSTSLSALLSSRGIGALGQVIGEYSAFALSGTLVLSGLFGGVIYFFGDELKDLIGHEAGAELLIAVILCFLMLSALQMLIFEITEGIMAGVLSQFFISLFLAYFSGCLYPVYFFPEAIQILSVYLPAGCADVILSRSLTGDAIGSALIILVLYLAAFLTAAVLVRRHRIMGRAGEEA